MIKVGITIMLWGWFLIFIWGVVGRHFSNFIGIIGGVVCLTGLALYILGGRLDS